MFARVRVGVGVFAACMCVCMCVCVCARVCVHELSIAVPTFVWLVAGMTDATCLRKPVYGLQNAVFLSFVGAPGTLDRRIYIHANTHIHTHNIHTQGPGFVGAPGTLDRRIYIHANTHILTHNIHTQGPRRRSCGPASASCPNRWPSKWETQA